MAQEIVEFIVGFMKNPATAFQRLSLAVREAGQYHEVLVNQAYYWLWQKLKPGTTLLDLGANIGDTALYFAAHPYVTRVISYEPMPFFYSIARDAISKCPKPLRAKIKLYNKGVASSSQTTVISANNKSVINYDAIHDRNGARISYVAMKDALKGLKNVAIKCDIEGAEKELFKNVDLSNVYAMQIEYHNNCKDQVLRSLKAQGYRLRADKAVGQKKNTGYIYASR